MVKKQTHLTFYEQNALFFFLPPSLNIPPLKQTNNVKLPAGLPTPRGSSPL